ATPVTLTYAASDAWNNDTPAASATTPNAIMMRGILKAGNGGWAVGRTEQFEFDSVPEGQYDVYVYLSMNGDNVMVNVADSYTNGSSANAYYVKEVHQFPDATAYVQGLNTSPTGVRDTCNYVKLHNVGTYGTGLIRFSVVHVQ